ncbi:IclR family transcriptional regulator [Paractinoplanes rhizophilus]|uniref:IclR family transcriptional regulator n=1 Tax=Paractinoplanes rhizophilus TaxID=1416877 RepID=A0ABW2HNU5_9ACTN|nr:IclR family transcriptional regulator [Actinoplanes sp.]
MIASGDGPDRRGEVRSVARALDILSAFSSAHPRLTLSELAEAVGLPRPSVRRLAVTLIERGFLRQDPDGAYLLGVRLLELGSQVSESSAITHRAGAAADELSRVTGETVLIAEVDWDSLSLLIIGKRRPVQPPPAETSPVGRRYPLTSGCIGKAVLSGLTPEGAATVVPKLRLTPRTAATIVDPARLAADVAASRDRGYAIQSGEFLVGMAGAAVPVHVSGRVVGALAVLGTAQRYPSPALHRTGRLVRSVLAQHRLAQHQLAQHQLAPHRPV